MLVTAHKNPTMKDTTYPAIPQRSQRRESAFCESPGGMRREGPRFASFKYEVQTAAGQVYMYICAWLAQAPAGIWRR